MNREQAIAEIERLVAERRRIDAELDQILGGVLSRRGRPPGSKSATFAPRRTATATRKKRGLTKGSIGFKIVEVLKRGSAPLNARAVAAAIGDKRVPMVATTLYRLQRSGYLSRAGRGSYRAG
jgi:hypothetical protein